MKKFTIAALLPLLLLSCQTGSAAPDRDFQRDMRNFVIRIALYARDTSHAGAKKNFIVIPQNGQELAAYSRNRNDDTVSKYVAVIDGTGREDLYYGFNADNQETPLSVRDYFISYLDRFVSQGKRVLVTDYCSSHVFMDDSCIRNREKKYISFAAPERLLNVIPNYPSHPYPHKTEKEADYPVTTLSEARNFLYLIDPDSGSPSSAHGTSFFPAKDAFLTALSNTNYDIIIMDAFFGDEEYTKIEIKNLKVKKSGGRRLVLAYLSIGEAEDYRYYWKTAWEKNPPGWLENENPEWKGNYKVRYWKKEWQDIIVSRKNSYIQKIMDAGFDGVYLDLVDAFEYFEKG